MAKKNLHTLYNSMINPISVSCDKIKMPMFGKYQTNPIAYKSSKADTFEHAKSITNLSFTSVDDTIVGRTVRELGDVPCPYCGIKLINGKEISHLNKENLGGRSEDAVALLQPFEDRMHPVEKNVFAIIRTLSKKNPDKNIRELLDTVRPQHLENVKKMEYETLGKMSEFVNKKISNENDSKKLTGLIDESKSIIEKQDENYIFRRRRFMQKFDAIAEEMQDKNSAQELKNIAEELPKAQDHVSTFIVKYTQKDPKSKQEKTPYQIGIALVEPSVGSLEHITPRHPQDESDGGKNLYSNYVYASREWNTKRKNMPLDQWVKQNPDIPKHMQKYMDVVIDKINKGEAFKKCRVYPIIAAETLEKESKGLIKINTSKLKLTPAQIKEERARVEKEEQKITEKAKNKAKNKGNKKTPKSINYIV